MEKCLNRCCYFYVGVKALLTDNDRVLLLKCKDNSKGTYYWDLPGGRIEDGESIANTLIRELKEELCDIKNIKIHNYIRYNFSS